MSNIIPLDVIIEKLKQYDETQVCDLLDITSEDLLIKFRARVVSKRKHLCSELEIFIGEHSEDEEPLDEYIDPEDFQEELDFD
jgi:hypothetical protein